MTNYSFKKTIPLLLVLVLIFNSYSNIFATNTGGNEPTTTITEGAEDKTEDEGKTEEDGSTEENLSKDENLIEEGNGLIPIVNQGTFTANPFTTLLMDINDAHVDSGTKVGASLFFGITSGSLTHIEDLKIEFILPENYEDIITIPDTMYTQDQQYKKYVGGAEVDATAKYEFDESTRTIWIVYKDFDIMHRGGKTWSSRLDYNIKDGFLPDGYKIEIIPKVYIEGTEITKATDPMSNEFAPFVINVDSQVDKYNTSITPAFYSTSNYATSTDLSDLATKSLKDTHYYQIKPSYTNSNTSGHIFVKELEAVVTLTLGDGLTFDKDKITVGVVPTSVTSNTTAYNTAYDIEYTPKLGWSVTKDYEAPNKIVLTIKYDAGTASTDVSRLSIGYINIHFRDDIEATFSAPKQPKITASTTLTYKNFTYDENGLGSLAPTNVTIADKSISFYRVTSYTDSVLEALEASDFSKGVTNTSPVFPGEEVTFTFDDIENKKNNKITNYTITDTAFDEMFEIISFNPGTIESGNQPTVQLSKYTGTNYVIVNSITNTASYPVSNPDEFSKGFKMVISELTAGQKYSVPPSVTMKVKSGVFGDYGKSLENTATATWTYYYNGLNTANSPTITDKASVVYQYNQSQSPIIPARNMYKSVSASPRTNSTYVEGDTLTYTLTLKNIDTNSKNLTDFVIEDIMDKYHDADTITISSITYPYGSNLALNNTKWDYNVNNLSVLDKSNSNETKLLWYFTGDLKPNETLTITYKVKIKSGTADVYMTNKFSQKVIDPNDSDKLINTTGDSSTTIYVTRLAPKVGIQIETDKTSVTARLKTPEVLTVYLTINNESFTDASGNPPANIDSLLLSTYLENYMYNNTPQTYGFDYKIDSATILKNGELNSKTNISNDRVDGISFTPNLTTTTINTYYKYEYLHFKLDNVNLASANEMITIKFEVTPKDMIFAETATTLSINRNITTAVYATSKYNGVDYTFKRLQNPINNTWGSVTGDINDYDNKTSTDYRTTIVKPITVNNADPQLSFQHDFRTYKEGTNYLEPKDDFQPGDTIHYVTNLYTSVAFNPKSFVITIPKGQTLDGDFYLKTSQTAKTGTGTLQTYTQLPNNANGDSLYKITYDTQLTTGYKYFGFKTVVSSTLTIDEAWELSKGKENFSITISHFLTRSNGYLMPSGVGGYKIVADEPTSSGGLDGDINTTHRVEYNKISTGTTGTINNIPYYWRSMLYPDISAKLSNGTNSTVNLGDGNQATWDVYPTGKLSNGLNMSEDFYIVLVLPDGFSYDPLLPSSTDYDPAKIKYLTGVTPTEKLVPTGITKPEYEKYTLGKSGTAIVLKVKDFFKDSNIGIRFNTKITGDSSYMYGTKTIKAYMVPTIDFYNDNVGLGSNLQYPSVPADLSTNMLTNEFVKDSSFSNGLKQAARAEASINIVANTAVASSVAVRVDRGNGIIESVTSSDGETLKVTPGAQIEYEAKMINASTSNTTLKDIVFIYQLPFESDRNPAGNEELNSQFSLEFVGIKPITDKNGVEINSQYYTIMVTEQSAPSEYSDTDWAGGNGEVTWKAYDPTSLTKGNIKAIRIVFKSTYPGITNQGGAIVVTTIAKVPDDIIPSYLEGDANSTFAWQSKINGSEKISPFSPKEVGITIVDPKDGNITIDKIVKNKDGTVINATDLGSKIYVAKLLYDEKGENTFAIEKDVVLDSSNEFSNTINGLIYGNYKVKEVYERIGDEDILINSDKSSYIEPVYSVTGNIFLNSTNKAKSIEITNQQKPATLTINKFTEDFGSDPVTRTATDGVRFKLYKGTDIVEANKVSDVVKTVSGGSYIFENLYQGDYTLVEYNDGITKPLGFNDAGTEVIQGTEYYRFTKKLTLPLSGAEGNVAIVSTENVINSYNFTAFEVTKIWVDNDDHPVTMGNPKDMVSFYLISQSDYNKNNKIDLNYNISTQKFENTNIGYGKYTLYEVTNPAYKPNSSAWEFVETKNDGDLVFKYTEDITINSDTETPLSVENKKIDMPKIMVEKKILNLLGEDISPDGRKFKLIAEGPNGYSKDFTLDTDNSYSEELAVPYFGVYTITEVSEVINGDAKPIGYYYTTTYTVGELSGNEVTLSYSENMTEQNVVVTNKELPTSINIQKTSQKAVGSDQYDNTAGIKFELLDMEGNVVRNSASTDGTGTLFFSSLPWGKYTLVEYSPVPYAPEDFTKAGEPVKIGGKEYSKYTKEIVLPDIDSDGYVLEPEIKVKNNLSAGEVVINKTITPLSGENAPSDPSTISKFYLVRKDVAYSENNKIEVPYDADKNAYYYNNVSYGDYYLYEETDVKYAPEGSWEYSAITNDGHLVFKYRNIITVTKAETVNLNVVNKTYTMAGINITKKVVDTNDQPVQITGKSFVVNVQYPDGSTNIFDLNESNQYTVNVQTPMMGTYLVVEAYEKVGQSNIDITTNYATTTYTVDGNNGNSFVQNYMSKDHLVEVVIINKEKEKDNNNREDYKNINNNIINNNNNINRNTRNNNNINNINNNNNIKNNNNNNNNSSSNSNNNINNNINKNINNSFNNNNSTVDNNDNNVNNTDNNSNGNNTDNNVENNNTVTPEGNDNQVAANANNVSAKVVYVGRFIAYQSDEDENLYYIFDQYGMALGYVIVPQGETIETINIDEELLPLTNLQIELLKGIKVNPKTGMSKSPILNILVPTLLLLVAVIKLVWPRAKKENGV